MQLDQALLEQVIPSLTKSVLAGLVEPHSRVEQQVVVELVNQQMGIVREHTNTTMLYFITSTRYNDYHHRMPSKRWGGEDICRHCDDYSLFRLLLQQC